MDWLDAVMYERSSYVIHGQRVALQFTRVTRVLKLWHLIHTTVRSWIRLYGFELDAMSFFNMMTSQVRPVLCATSTTFSSFSIII